MTPADQFTLFVCLPLGMLAAGIVATLVVAAFHRGKGRR
jgi:hypothetical protein